MLVALLVMLEREVLDERRPKFVRAYAWYRLLRHWCALRFSDGDGLSPDSLWK